MSTHDIYFTDHLIVLNLNDITQSLSHSMSSFCCQKNPATFDENFIATPHQVTKRRTRVFDRSPTVAYVV